jgi:hypothetical protein
MAATEALVASEEATIVSPAIETESLTKLLYIFGNQRVSFQR